MNPFDIRHTDGRTRTYRSSDYIGPKILVSISLLYMRTALHGLCIFESIEFYLYSLSCKWKNKNKV